MKNGKKISKKLAVSIISLCVLSIVFLADRFIPGIMDAFYETTGLSTSTDLSDDGLRVHFIDVGQGDSILIQTDEHFALIDAGTPECEEELVAYLKEMNVQKLDFVMATHPHLDHIGSMPRIIKEFAVENVILSDMPEKMIPTTRTYEKLLDAIDEKDVPIIKAKPGDVFNVQDASLKILAPLEGYDDLNDLSIVCRLDYEDSSFLFTGDAEKQSEKGILSAYPEEDLKADVLKLGHHGSSTSSSVKFLDAVSPQIAIACVGEENSYGHPHKETIEHLKTRMIKMYRTDLDGTIVIGGKDTLDVWTSKTAA